jgi:hypothetical protein
MKTHGTTTVPRKQGLNQALVELGHKVHKDSRSKLRDREKEDKLRKEWLEEALYEL